ncbi:thiopurine S-methyltransferase-like [Styela clava]
MSSNEESRTNLTTNGWDDYFWKSGQKDPPFHVQEVHSTVKKFYNRLFSEGKTGRIFIPLCGKSLDLIYFADLGHDVVGLEFSEVAVESFFAENNLKFTKYDLENEPFVVYKCLDKAITLYRGDFFKLKPEICGQFDAFWDRGSFIAINMGQRLEYAEIMFKLMKNMSKYLLQGAYYDGTKYAGPPHYLSEDSLKETLGKRYSYELLETRESTPPIPNLKMDWTINIYLLEPKVKGSL